MSKNNQCLLHNVCNGSCALYKIETLICLFLEKFKGNFHLKSFIDRNENGITEEHIILEELFYCPAN